MSRIKQLAVKSIARGMAWLKSNPHFKEWYASFNYDEVNRGQFAAIKEQEKMLADEVRFDAYSRAIDKYVGPGDKVLDVGTGSGILSFLAAARGAAKVVAIDHSDFIDAARYIAEQNGIANIEFVKTHSSELELPEKVDVILHDQIGSGLFDENMVETIIDLRERVLSEGGRILPAKFELFLEPVQLKEENRVPFIWDHRFPNADYSCLKEFWRERVQAPSGMRPIQPHAVDYLLAKPERLYACDLHTMQRDDLPREFRFQRVVERDGHLDGVCLFFRILFDEETSVSTFHDCKPTHWSTPNFRVEPRSCRRGEVLEFHLQIDDVRHLETWKLEVRSSADQATTHRVHEGAEP